MLAYNIDNIPIREYKRMQIPFDTLLFEKVQCEPVNEDGEWI